MIPWLIGNLLGTKLGRTISTGLIILAIVALVMSTMYRMGKRSARVEQELQNLNAIRERIKTDEEVRSMSAADRRATLKRWVRGG